MTDAFDAFEEVAPNRNSCYQINYSSSVSISQVNSFPSNTTGYYEINSSAVYQSPMFLMMYFAYIASETLLNQVEFAINSAHIAGYLRDSKDQLVQTAIGGIKHPHYPETYYLLARYISQAEYN
ncbi:MAG: hypothetical protein ACI3XR_07565 [Eubacteriales bacterium]